jgi:L,D-transpeptidase YbiS
MAGFEVMASPNNFALNFITRWVWTLGLFLGLVLATLILLSVPLLREWTFELMPGAKFSSMQFSSADLHPLRQETRQLEKRGTSLRKKLKGLIPQEPYLIIDSADNRIFLMSGEKVLHQGTCSTGSYIHLKAHDGREWLFTTPRGMFSIKRKKEKPVWKKPDWAFIEDGEKVPAPNAPERFEAGVLGAYALEIGNGYMIHGTLYKRLLGMPVTHGCVRLDDRELDAVYQNLQVGSHVFIY